MYNINRTIAKLNKLFEANNWQTLNVIMRDTGDTVEITPCYDNNKITYYTIMAKHDNASINLGGANTLTGVAAKLIHYTELMDLITNELPIGLNKVPTTNCPEWMHNGAIIKVEDEAELVQLLMAFQKANVLWATNIPATQIPKDYGIKCICVDRADDNRLVIRYGYTSYAKNYTHIARECM